MKKIVLILVILILLGGGGGAAWWFFLRAPDEAAEEVVEAPPPVLSQIPLAPFPVSVVKDGSVARTIWFELVLTFDDPEKHAAIEARLPQLNDALVAELHGLLPRKMVEQSGYDERIIKDRLLKVLAERFGEGMVHDLTIRNMQILDSK